MIYTFNNELQWRLFQKGVPIDLSTDLGQKSHLISCPHVQNGMLRLLQPLIYKSPMNIFHPSFMISTKF
jgi:hypothetical protein